MTDDYIPPAKPFGELTEDERWAWLLGDTNGYFNASALHRARTFQQQPPKQQPRAPRRWWPWRRRQGGRQ